MAIVSKTFRCGPTLQYDNSDWMESRAEELDHINPSLEFWLKENASSFTNALVIGAGFGLSSKQLVDAGVTVTSLEPLQSRFDLLETNVPESTNIRKAAGSLAGNSTIYTFTDVPSAAVVGKQTGNLEYDVEVITIDSLDLNPDLILVYANGKELDALAGATETLSNNPNAKIIIKWIPDLIEDIDTAVEDLKALNKTIHIIHWEEDDSISLKTQFNGDYPEDSLKAVGTADLLLE